MSVLTGCRITGFPRRLSYTHCLRKGRPAVLTVTAVVRSVLISLEQAFGLIPVVNYDDNNDD